MSFFLSSNSTAKVEIRDDQFFTSAGTYSWTVPDGVTSISIVAVGAGGGGGGAIAMPGTSYYSGGGGGGGGALAYRNNVPVTPGQVLTVVVGAGGGGGTTYTVTNPPLTIGYYGSRGGDSYVISSSTTVVSAGGGGGGYDSPTISPVGPLVIASGGSVIVGEGGANGGDGGGTRYPPGAGINIVTGGGGGGGAGGYNGPGGAGGTAYMPPLGYTPSNMGNAAQIDGGGGGGGSAGFATPGLTGALGGGVNLFGLSNSALGVGAQSAVGLNGSLITQDNVSSIITILSSPFTYSQSTTLTLTSGTADDGYFTVSVPWGVNVQGVVYTAAYVGTNSYVTFGGGSTNFSALTSANPAFPKIMIDAADNSCQTLYSLITGTTPNRIQNVVFEGTASTSGTVGNPNIKWIMLFYESDTSIVDLFVSLDARGGGGLSGVYTASTALTTQFFSLSTPYRIKISSTSASSSSPSTADQSYNAAAFGANNYFTLPASSNFNFDDRDFTIECLIRPIASGPRGILNTWMIGGAWIFRLSNSTTLEFKYTNNSTSTTQVIYTGSTVISTSKATHVALTRYKGVLQFYINGVKDPVSYNAGYDTIYWYNNSLKSLYVGADSDTTNLFQGHLSNIRIVKGQAVYKRSFVPSPSNFPLTNVPGTVALLLTNYGGIADSSNYGWPISYGSPAPGTPAVSTATATVIPGETVFGGGGGGAASSLVTYRGGSGTPGAVRIVWPGVSRGFSDLQVGPNR